MDLQQGSCIRLAPNALDPLTTEGLPEGLLPPVPPGRCGASDAAPVEQLNQVIGLDHNGNRCWLRRWPLGRQGSPVFEVPLQQLQGRAGHRPLPAGRHEA
jgi:hypothetical protein